MLLSPSSDIASQNRFSWCLGAKIGIILIVSIFFRGFMAAGRVNTAWRSETKLHAGSAGQDGITSAPFVSIAFFSINLGLGVYAGVGAAS